MSNSLLARLPKVLRLGIGLACLWKCQSAEEFDGPSKPPRLGIWHRPKSAAAIRPCPDTKR
eukprot:5695814-Amphidinium_carterae.1